MKIYFAGSIRGENEKVNDYAEIINVLEESGEVLTDTTLTNNDETIGDAEIYKHDIELLKACDLLVADITISSLDVGYEIGYANFLGKKIICCYEIDKNISRLIKGNSNILQIPYTDILDLIIKIKEVMEELKIW